MTVVERQDRGRNCPAAIFTPRQTDVSLGPLGQEKTSPETNRKGFSGSLKTLTSLNKEVRPFFS